MYALQYSFNFRYRGGSKTVINIPVDDYIATGREVDEYEVWEHILGNDDLANALAEQVTDFPNWMRMPDYYAKELQRQNTSLRIVKIED